MDFSNSVRKTCDEPEKNMGSFKWNKRLQLDEEHSQRRLAALSQCRNVYRGNLTLVTPWIQQYYHQVVLFKIYNLWCWNQGLGSFLRQAEWSLVSEAERERQQQSTVRCSIATWWIFNSMIEKKNSTYKTIWPQLHWTKFFLSNIWGVPALEACTLNLNFCIVFVFFDSYCDQNSEFYAI